MKPKETRIEYANFTLIGREVPPVARSGGRVVQLAAQPLWDDARTRPSGLRAIEASTARHTRPEVPGEVQTAVQISKKPFVRRAAARVAKIAAGAGAGYVLGKRHGPAVGATVGGVAGLLFEDPLVRRNIRLATEHARKLINL